MSENQTVFGLESATNTLIPASSTVTAEVGRIIDFADLNHSHASNDARKPHHNAVDHPDIQQHVQQSPATPTTFHGFGSIPAELQQQIWEDAADSLPTITVCEFRFGLAQHKTLGRTRGDPGLVACFHPSKRLIVQTHGHRALLKACAQSRLQVLKRFDMLPFQHAVSSGPETTETRQGRVPFDTEASWLVITDLAEVVDKTFQGASNIELPDHFETPHIFSRIGGFDFAPMVKKVSIALDPSFEHSLSRGPDSALCVEHILTKLDQVERVGHISMAILQDGLDLPKKRFRHYNRTLTLTPGRHHAHFRRRRNWVTWSQAREAERLRYKCLSTRKENCTTVTRVDNSSMLAQWMDFSYSPWP